MLRLMLVAVVLGSWCGGSWAATSDLRFRSGDVELAGTVHRPAGASGPVPGVVIVQGSGNSGRSNPWTAAWVAGLAARGVAVLHFDKRGSGESGGSWKTSGFEDLAQDALAAVEALRATPGLDPGNVGVVGFSQGGKVAGLAAELSAGVAFAVDVSGSVTPFLDQVGDEIRLDAIREGVTAEGVAAAARLHGLAMRWVRDREGWEDYIRAVDEAASGPLAGTETIGAFPTDPDAWPWDFLRAMGPFDPMEHWSRVRVPALFVLGGRDDRSDVRATLARLPDLGDAGVNCTVLLLGPNGHALVRDDALDFLVRWIRDRGAP